MTTQFYTVFVSVFLTNLIIIQQLKTSKLALPITIITKIFKLTSGNSPFYLMRLIKQIINKLFSKNSFIKRSKQNLEIQLTN